MTPAMHVSVVKASYRDQLDAEAIIYDLERVYQLGHEFGIERAAGVVDQCNREGPYNAVGAASRIRALKVVEVEPVKTIDKGFV